MAVREDPSPADCEIHIHGEVKELGPRVPRGVPQVVSKPGEKVDIAAKESGRLELAQWLTRARQSSHCARCRESHLGASVRKRHRPHRR